MEINPKKTGPTWLFKPKPKGKRAKPKAKAPVVPGRYTFSAEATVLFDVKADDPAAAVAQWETWCCRIARGAAGGLVVVTVDSVVMHSDGQQVPMPATHGKVFGGARPAATEKEKR